MVTTAQIHKPKTPAQTRANTLLVSIEDFENITKRAVTPDDLVYLDTSIPSALEDLEEAAWSSAVYSFKEDQLMAELSVAELFSQSDRITVTIDDSRQGSEPLYQADTKQSHSAET